jgi:hypothetical protein
MGTIGWKRWDTREISWDRDISWAVVVAAFV